MISRMIKKFLKQLDVDAHVILPYRFVIHLIGHQKRIVAPKSLSFFR